jgi:hypothetical protein
MENQLKNIKTIIQSSLNNAFPSQYVDKLRQLSKEVEFEHRVYVKELFFRMRTASKIVELSYSHDSENYLYEFAHYFYDKDPAIDFEFTLGEYISGYKLKITELKYQNECMFPENKRFQTNIQTIERLGLYVEFLEDVKRHVLTQLWKEEDFLSKSINELIDRKLITVDTEGLTNEINRVKKVNFTLSVLSHLGCISKDHIKVEAQTTEEYCNRIAHFFTKPPSAKTIQLVLNDFHKIATRKTPSKPDNATAYKKGQEIVQKYRR